MCCNLCSNRNPIVCSRVGLCVLSLIHPHTQPSQHIHTPTPTHTPCADVKISLGVVFGLSAPVDEKPPQGMTKNPGYLGVCVCVYVCVCD